MDAAPHCFAVRLYVCKVRVDSVKTVTGKPFFLLSLPFYLVSRIDEYRDWFMNEVRNR